MQQTHWTADAEWIQKEKTRRYILRLDDKVLTYQQVVTLWCNSRTFCSYFNNLLAESTFTAFRWETPCVTIETIAQPFEFVLVNCPGLDRPVDPLAFANQFRLADGASVISFTNLSGRSTMIAPVPPADETPECAFGHLAAFVRNASAEQQLALWQVTGKVTQQHLSSQPLWLSTAGAGVSWLHIRLDPTPKYYHHGPYRDDQRGST